MGQDGANIFIVPYDFPFNMGTIKNKASLCCKEALFAV